MYDLKNLKLPSENTIASLATRNNRVRPNISFKRLKDNVVDQGPINSEQHLPIGGGVVAGVATVVVIGDGLGETDKGGLV